MRRISAICLTLVAAALLIVPSVASAAKKKGPTPKITRVTPMRLGVGQTLTIRGKNFKAKRKQNTIVFRAPNGRSAFAKPRRASRTKLVVVVPEAVSRLLVSGSGKPSTKRFKLRVLAGKFSKFTSRRLSPVIVGSGAGGNGDGPDGNAACNSSSDHDGDLLANSYELQIGTDPCLRDTDLDGVEDGYEQQSAIDLNHYPRTPPLPYPGKRPYPNALDSTDASTDYDGDGMLLREEYLLWVTYVADGAARGGRPTTLANLLYSDGLQKSIDPAPWPPVNPLGGYGEPDAVIAWSAETRLDSQLWDDERDADNDGLSNWDEQHGRMTEPWWPAQHDGTNEPKESKYPGINFLDNDDTAPAYNAFVDPDMDGDGVPDGADDADHDGLSNVFEVNRPDDWVVDAWGAFPAANPWAYVNPFNPCKPFNTERCHKHPPFGYYESDEAPPIGPDPPPGYPSGRPATPDG